MRAALGAPGLVAVEGIVVGRSWPSRSSSPSDHLDALVPAGVAHRVPRLVVDRRRARSPGGAGRDNRFGVLMTARRVRLVPAAPDRRGRQLAVHDRRLLVSSLYLAVFVHMVLAFPGGRPRDDRRLRDRHGRLRSLRGLGPRSDSSCIGGDIHERPARGPGSANVLRLSTTRARGRLRRGLAGPGRGRPGRAAVVTARAQAARRAADAAAAARADGSYCGRWHVFGLVALAEAAGWPGRRSADVAYSSRPLAALRRAALRRSSLGLVRSRATAAPARWAELHASASTPARPAGAAARRAGSPRSATAPLRSCTGAPTRRGVGRRTPATRTAARPGSGRAVTPRSERDGERHRRDRPRRARSCDEPRAGARRSRAAAALALENERLEAELRARAGRAARLARRGSSRPATPSAGGSSATCTTAPSSGSSRSRSDAGWRSGWPHEAGPGDAGCSSRRARSSRARAGRAARARPRHPPGGPAPTSGLAAGARGARRAARRCRWTLGGRRASGLPAAGRGGRLLRRGRGADQRGQVRAGAAQAQRPRRARRRRRRGRGRRRRRRRRRSGARLGPARARRPRRGARRAPRGSAHPPGAGT